VGLRPCRRCVSRTSPVVTAAASAKSSPGAEAVTIKSRIIRAAMPRGSRSFLPESGRMRVLVIHGPNLNMLGEREPAVYGSSTLAQIDERIAQLAGELKIEVRSVQHNSEGAIVDELHAARNSCDAVIVNPGAYTHYAHAIADAISAIGIPVIEVHLSNIFARESFRRISVIAPVCVGTIAGFGVDSYLLALRAAAR